MLNNIYTLFQGRMSNRFTKDVAIMDDYLPISLFDLLQVSILIEFIDYIIDLFVVSFQSIRYSNASWLAQSLVIHSSHNICYCHDIYSPSLCSMFA
jgi:hypothetical protein